MSSVPEAGPLRRRQSKAAELLMPDAVLLDLRLPDGSGFEVSGLLTAARPELAVLLISADHSPPPDGRVEACGARGFVPKCCLAATPLERFWRGPERHPDRMMPRRT